MFSSRFHWDLAPNEITRRVEARKASGRELLDLTESNPARAGLVYPDARLLDALANAANLRYEPSPAGVLSAREAVAAYYGGTVGPDRILLTASTSESYAYLFKLLTDPGDEILVPRPSYPLFEFLAAMESVTVKTYPLRYHGVWEIDFEALQAALSARTRAIIIVNPNNPTGSFVKPHELEMLAALQIPLISDEVFADYAFGPALRTISGVEGTLAFSLSGLSKVSGLPQLKLGWIAVSGPDALRAEAWQRLELIADTYLSVSAPAQNALPELLAMRHGIQDQIRGRCRANLACFRSMLPGHSPARLLNVEGGWYATLEVPRTRTEEEWVLSLLEEHGVLLQPGYFFDFEREAFLVLSLLTNPARFGEGAERILAHIAG